MIAPAKEPCCCRSWSMFDIETLRTFCKPCADSCICKRRRPSTVFARWPARYYQLSKEIHDLKAELERLTRTAAPALVSVFGVGPDTAATLLIAAGSNPERLHSEAAFASLCGVSPIPASSGKTNRHRLNRGGDRQANAALCRIVVVRHRQDFRTKAYMRRRTGEGMNKTEVIRCLKRQVAREVFSALQHSAGIIGSAA